MQVTVRVRQETAQALRRRNPPTRASRELLQAAEGLGVALVPMHPRVPDPQLASYFVVEVPDRATAERTIADLTQCEAVEAAYVKPSDALP